MRRWRRWLFLELRNFYVRFFDVKVNSTKCGKRGVEGPDG